MPEADEDLAWRHFDTVVGYVRTYPQAMDDPRTFAEAASDALDGMALAREVAPLVRMGLMVTEGIPDRSERTLGNAVTWALTGKGMALVRARLAGAGLEADGTFEGWLADMRANTLEQFCLRPDEFRVPEARLRARYDRGMTPEEAFRDLLREFAAGGEPAPPTAFDAPAETRRLDGYLVENAQVVGEIAMGMRESGADASDLDDLVRGAGEARTRAGAFAVANDGRYRTVAEWVSEEVAEAHLERRLAWVLQEYGKEAGKVAVARALAEADRVPSPGPR